MVDTFLLCVTFVGPRLSTCSGYPPFHGQHSTPCGESFFEGDRSVSTTSFKSENKENDIHMTFENSTKLSSATNALPAGLSNYYTAQAQCPTGSSISVSSASMKDPINTDSLLLTKLLDSSDDEWANTCMLDTNSRQRVSVSTTSTSTALYSSGSRMNSVASTPYNQQASTTASSQNKSTTTIPNNISNNFNSSFNSPQRTNTIPNNGNDSKLAGDQCVLVYCYCLHSS